MQIVIRQYLDKAVAFAAMRRGFVSHISVKSRQESDKTAARRGHQGSCRNQNPQAKAIKAPCNQRWPSLARALGNIRTGVSWSRYDIALWGKNLFKDRSSANGVFIPNPARRSDLVLGLLGIQPPAGFEAFGALSLAPEPRTWGVTARAKF